MSRFYLRILVRMGISGRHRYPHQAATEGSEDADLRRRCKHLGHIPESAAVIFVEADLVGVVGVKGLRPFEAAIKVWRARGREKDRVTRGGGAHAYGREGTAWFSSGAAATDSLLCRSSNGIQHSLHRTRPPSPPRRRLNSNEAVRGALSFAVVANTGSSAGAGSTLQRHCYSISCAMMTMMT